VETTDISLLQFFKQNKVTLHLKELLLEEMATVDRKSGSIYVMMMMMMMITYMQMKEVTIVT
jgi:hypothetical protein